MGRKSVVLGIVSALLLCLSASCGGKEYVVEYGVDGYVYQSKRIWSKDGVDDLKLAGDSLYFMQQTDNGTAVKRVFVAADGDGPDFSKAETLAEFNSLAFELPEGTGENGEDIDVLGLLDGVYGGGITNREDLEKDYGMISLDKYAVSPEGDLYCYLKIFKGSYLEMEEAGGVLCRQTPEGERAFGLYLPEMLDFAVDGQGRVFVLMWDEIRVLDREGNRTGAISTEGYHMDGRPPQEELFVDSEGRIYYSMLNKKYVRATYELTGKGNLHLEDAGKFLGEWSFSPAPDGNIFQYGGGEGSLYLYDRDAGSKREILNWGDSGLINNGIRSVTEIGPGVLLVNFTGILGGQGGVYQLTKTPVEELPEKELLVIASPLYPLELQRAVITFNARSDSYRVVVDSYGAWYSDAEMRWVCPQLDVSLMSGNPPDLLDLRAFNISKYAQKGVLEDLFPYVEQSGVLEKGDLPDNLLEGLTFDGKLVCMPLSFLVKGVVARASQVEGDGSWTMEDVYRLTEQHPESVGGAVDDGYGQRAQVDWILGEFSSRYYLEAFVDWGKWECSFDSDGFRRLVEWAGRYGWTPEHIEERFETTVAESIYIPQEVLLVSQDGLGFTTLAGVELQYGEEVCLQGYPTSDGRDYFPAYINGGLGIASGSPHKEAAWEFLECYLEVNSSMLWGGIPASKIKIRELYEKESTPDYVGDAAGGQEVMRIKGYVGVGRDYIPYYVIPKEQADAILKAIETADFRPISETEEMITKIVVEEAESYCHGDKSLEEVTRLIQNRVQLLLNEVKP